MLQITELKKTFNRGSVNEVAAIRSLDCVIDDGDFVTLIGSNGAGKSTLLNLIAGTYPPDEGDIFLGKERLTRLPEYLRAAHIGRVFQDPLLGTCGSMTIEENFAMAARRGLSFGLRRGVTREDREDFRKRLGHLGLGLESRLRDKVGLLSGGQRQSLTLLMATIRQPDLLLLDEHTAALDPRTTEQVLALTKELVQEMRLTAIMVTHNMRYAVEVGNRLMMMHQGRVILDVAGENKERLTIQDLLNEFALLKGEQMAEDEMLLL